MVGILVTSIAGALLTYYFVDKMKWTAVKSSALLTLFFASAAMAVNAYFPFEHELYSTYFFGASFVGMSSTNRLSYLLITCSGLLYGVLLFLFKDYFSGIGGGLGSTACITVIVLFLVQQLSNKLIYNTKSDQ
ncbi:MAG: hypothetical protein ACJA0Q_001121 [Saprospiraceae bacterium]|jgi:hypothetical protein